MIEYRTLTTARRTGADNHVHPIFGRSGPILMDDYAPLERPAYSARKPGVIVVSRSAPCAAKPLTIDRTDCAEIKAPSETGRRRETFPRSAVDSFFSAAAGATGPMLVVAAAAMVAITFSLTPASDGPAPVAGPLSGHSILHFPR